MMTLFRKEFFDALRWVPLGAIAAAVLVWINLPTQLYTAAGADQTFVTQLGLAAALIAFALGLLQSLPDTRTESRGYLLHRTLTPANIFWAKVGAGLVAYAASLIIPVALAAVYLESKGLETLPTSAEQLVPFLCYSLLVFLLHPMAICIANRDARWLGTRVLPMVLLVAALFSVAVAIQSRFRWNDVGVLLLVYVGLIWLVLDASRHTFAVESFLPPASARRRYRFSLTSLLLLSSLVLVGVVVVTVVQSFPVPVQDFRQYRFAMDREGNWQQLQLDRSRSNWNSVDYALRSPQGSTEFEPLDDDWRGAPMTALADVTLPEGIAVSPFVYAGTFASGSDGSANAMVIHHDRVLAYVSGMGLSKVVTPDGVFDTAADATGRFRKVVFPTSFGGDLVEQYAQRTNPLIADADGVYQLDVNGWSIRQILDTPIDGLGLLFSKDSASVSLWTRTGDTLNQYRVSALSGEPQPPMLDDPSLYQLPVMTLDLVASYPISPVLPEEQIQVMQSPDGTHAVARLNLRTNAVRYRTLEPSAVTELDAVQLPANEYGNPEDAAVAWGIPPALSSVTAALAHFRRWDQTSDLDSTKLILYISLHAILAALVAYWLASSRGLGRTGRVGWTLLALLLGFGTLLAMIATFPKPVRVACPRCNQPRRVDLENCEHCGKPWEHPAPEGIEIFSDAIPQTAQRSETVS
ncbi:hypothetical protein FYK55_11300 [Roseiconus nitratireducens]|uniref:Uncharacterized protein n=1 Tax=Roseiconus nitratireducens TaxID=2605748 RepID=A0A5M6DBI3_9BACT|nr:hypothetical protein [Roseiconus nitratireducens]KAA5543760.1 hypothetical protein FYK55_11300 [Roseiconus nitratireducens]